MGCASQRGPADAELIALNQSLIDALARGDRATVERIYSDRFVRTTLQGGLLTRSEVLAALNRPGAPKVSYESKDIQVVDYGHAAIVTYLSIRHAEGKPDFLYRVTDTFVKDRGRWVKAASAGTPVLAQAP